MKKPRIHQDSLADKRLWPREQEALAIVTAEPGIGCAEIAERMGVKSTTAGCYMNQLSVARMVHCRGYGRWATWWPGEAPPKVIEVARVKLGPNSVWSMA
jgi:DNA-binding IclR family transcriptional regulator